MKTRLIVGHKANLGLVRDTMEDAYSIKAGSLDADVRRKGSLLVVADGVGGYQAGEVASNMAANGIIASYYASDNPDRIEALHEAILDTNTKIYQRAQETNYKKMSTTIVCALIYEGALILAHVGDSRAYLYRGGQLLQLTQDHSWVNEQIKQGLMTPEQVATSPVRNVITQSLGNNANVNPEINAFGALENQDRLMLCTDGLYELVAPLEVKPILEKLAPQSACEALVERANRAGGTDNVTVIVVEFRSDTTVEKTDAASPAVDATQPETIQQAAEPSALPKYKELEVPVSKPDVIQSNCSEASVYFWKLHFSFSSKSNPLSKEQKQFVKLTTGEMLTCGFTIGEDQCRGVYPNQLEVWADVGERSFHHWLVGCGAVQEKDRLKSKTTVVFDGVENAVLTSDDPLIVLKIEKCQFASGESAIDSYYAFDEIEFSFLIIEGTRQ